MDPARWTTPKDVADTCDVDLGTVYRWCRLGTVKARRPGGGQWRIAVDGDGFPLDADSDGR